MILTFNKDTHTYRIDGEGVKSVTQILQDEGIIDFSKVNPKILIAAQLFGKAVHKSTELHDKRDLNEKTLDHALRPYLDAWIKLKKDTSWINEEIETPIVSKILRVAGTPDRIGRFTKSVASYLLNRKAVLDIKSSFQDAIAIQTAGYEKIYNEWKQFKDKVRVRVGIVLKGNGNYDIEIYKDKMDTNIFMSALCLNHYKRR